MLTFYGILYRMEKQTAPSKSQLPSWVQDQQHQSWQIEILIASGLIFFLTKIPKYLGNWFAAYGQANDFGPESVILLIGALYFSHVLLIGFVINLILRALWLAYLGINFVYPNDINFKNLGYSTYFQEKLAKKPTAIERIIRLENISSLSYSMTLILTVMTFGIFILLSAVFFVMKYIWYALYDSQEFGMAFMLFLFLASLGALDYFFFRLLKRSKKISKWYYPFYSFYSWVSLSFLFKREWLVLISNGKRWVIYSLFLVFFTVSFFLATDDIDRYVGNFDTFTLNLYEDRAYLDIPTYNSIKNERYNNLLPADEKIEVWCISHDVIRENSTWVFVVYDKWMDRPLQQILENYEFQMNNFKAREELFANDQKFSDALSQFFRLSVDSIPLEATIWYYHQHPISQETGFKAYINLDSIDAGNHLLHLDRLQALPDTTVYYPYSTIAFFKE